jgi:hypothetical protein
MVLDIKTMYKGQLVAFIEAYGSGWTTLSMDTLGAICQRLGQSGRGTRQELIDRISAAVDQYKDGGD